MLKMGSNGLNICQPLSIVVYGTSRGPATFLPLSRKARSTSRLVVPVTQHHEASLCRSLFTWKQTGLS